MQPEEKFGFVKGTRKEGKKGFGERRRKGPTFLERNAGESLKRKQSKRVRVQTVS